MPGKTSAGTLAASPQQIASMRPQRNAGENVVSTAWEYAADKLQ